MITSPLCRPVCGPLATALTDARVSAPAGDVAATWSAAAKTANCALSNGDLTASTIEFDNYAEVRSTTSHDTGKRAIKMTLTYTAAASTAEIMAGFASAAWAHDGGGLGVDYLWLFEADGYGFHNPDFTGDLGIPVASGGSLYAFVDFDAGEIRFNNANAVPGSAALTLTPNTPLYLACVMFSNTPPSPVSLTIDPTYSSGAYAAWNA